MRTEKLGSRLLRVVTPDGKVRYFRSAPGLPSLRLFWIFRNFGNLKDSVLSAEQRALIRQIYRMGEVPRATVDPTKVLGTLEVTNDSIAPGWAAPARVIQLSIVPPASADRQDSGKLVRLAFNLAGAIGVLLFIVGLLGSRDARRPRADLALNPASAAESQQPHSSQTREVRQLTTLRSLVPHEPAQGTELDPRPNVADKTLDPGAGPSSSREPPSSASHEDDPGGLSVSSLSTTNSQGSSSVVAATSVDEPIQSLQSSALSSSLPTEELPPSGPPQTRPFLADFSPVSQDTEVILRAIVSADGSVTKVKVLAGNSQAAREAARAVASWRYTPRSSHGNAESLIAFRFLAPDTVSVSFLDSATADARR